MASSSTYLFSELSETLLFCDICQEEFDSRNNLPRILPCHHSFCGNCLLRMTKDQQLRCPKCRCTVPAEGAFPVDATRVILLDFVSTFKNLDSVACEGCLKTGRTMFHCRDCAKFICDSCCSVHHSRPEMKDHAINSVAEAFKLGTEQTQSVERCPQHLKKLKYFCTTCQLAICSVCAIVLHSGHSCTELKNVIEEKRQKVQMQCNVLDIIQQGLQLKLQAAEASLESLETNYKEIVSRVETVFAELVSAILDKQARVLESLASMVVTSRRVLDEQLTIFQNLLKTCQTTADNGKQVNSLSLPTHILSLEKEIRPVIDSLKKLSKTPVKTAPVYQLDSQELEILKATLERIGTVETSSADILASGNVNNLPVQFCSLDLDTNDRGPGCSVSLANNTLSNQHQMQFQLKHQERTPVYKFQGTSSTVPLPPSTCYWQVKCVAIPHNQFAYGVYLCEMGVATKQALHASSTNDTAVLSSSRDHCSFSFGLYVMSTSIHAMALFRHAKLSDRLLASTTPYKTVSHTFGFLLSKGNQKRHLYVIDVGRERVLWNTIMDTSQPLWPVIRVWPAGQNNAEVTVKLQREHNITMTNDFINLLLATLNQIGM